VGEENLFVVSFLWQFSSKGSRSSLIINLRQMTNSRIRLLFQVKVKSIFFPDLLFFSCVVLYLISTVLNSLGKFVQ